MNESLTNDSAVAQLRGAGIGLRIGPFAVRVRSEIAEFAQLLGAMYRDYPRAEPDDVYSCHLSLQAVRPLRRPWRPQVRFLVDGRAPHEDMPVEQAFAVFEWGLNLVLALRMQSFLMLHAAVVERHGRALVLPAAPGCGKTTLCAALSNRGWRQLSDEFGLLRPTQPDFLSLPRPMPLKNASIDIMRSFAPRAHMGPEITGTRKGTVAHLRAATDCVRRQQESAAARWLVFPQWRAGAEFSLQPIPREDAFMRVATNAFNYELQGATGFETVRAVVDRSTCYELEYSDLAQAVDALTAMADADVH